MCVVSERRETGRKIRLGAMTLGIAFALAMAACGGEGDGEATDSAKSEGYRREPG